MMAPLLSNKAGVLLTALSSVGVILAGPVDIRQDVAARAADVSTITGYAHPLTLTALHTLLPDQSPLSYASPPTAIPVPTRLLPAPGDKAAEATGVQVQAAGASESEPAASQTNAPSATSVCTSIRGSYPTATIPNFCNPSAQVNAASFVPGRTDIPTATVTIGAVSNKLDCCVQCAGIFNCVAWRFVPVYTQAPNAHLPGGFDPWGRGDCEAVYHTGNPDDEPSTTHDETAANLCPNGKVGELLASNDAANGISSTTNATTPTGSWTNLYFNGWNEGPCAEPVAPFESGKDAGRGDAANLCA
ncbi:uncharacterized protein F4812DRAFT_119471 [Daldinia caldariorum]|uniref:uncharacterized protein n=1 Tax=Daldinia caldariorum TaxID=326644 RepID=UPI002008A2D3|nr:uncharacterized protein F4812DRAFT_119471 [Daldinia caldariorum]KAI1465373.1 hypothetical protein F4812DRAFT_119471 [Daldinia caldariorum]